MLSVPYAKCGQVIACHCGRDIIVPSLRQVQAVEGTSFFTGDRSVPAEQAEDRVVLYRSTVCLFGAQLGVGTLARVLKWQLSEVPWWPFLLVLLVLAIAFSYHVYYLSLSLGWRLRATMLAVVGLLPFGNLLAVIILSYRTKHRLHGRGVGMPSFQTPDKDPARL